MYVHTSMEIPLQQNYPVEGRCLQLRTPGPNNHLLSSTNTENVVSNSAGIISPQTKQVLPLALTIFT